ncbi:hypothetical protein V491_00142 [Pseudogymnoascus sp. VKM F-3775]|nr:hypothetical protein V491_00142 [Pseudogymnoascus sp. VKM F-3775]
MSDNEKQNNNYATDEVQSETEEEPEEEPQQQEQPVATQPNGQRTMQHARQNRRQNEPLAPQYQEQQMVSMTDQQLTGGSTGAIRQSRIKDRPKTDDAYDRPATDWEYGRHHQDRVGLGSRGRSLCQGQGRRYNWIVGIMREQLKDQDRVGLGSRGRSLCQGQGRRYNWILE